MNVDLKYIRLVPLMQALITYPLLLLGNNELNVTPTRLRKIWILLYQGISEGGLRYKTDRRKVDQESFPFKDCLPTFTFNWIYSKL